MHSISRVVFRKKMRSDISCSRTAAHANQNKKRETNSQMSKNKFHLQYGQLCSDEQQATYRVKCISGATKAALFTCFDFDGALHKKWVIENSLKIKRFLFYKLLPAFHPSASRHRSETETFYSFFS